jgi:FkbM family methyltransferase
MRYSDIAAKFANTPLSKMPGILLIHRLILNFLEWKHQLTAGEEWIAYNGAKLYADTSDHVAKGISINGEYEPEVTEKIIQYTNNGDIAVDIGGHIGHHSVTMRQRVGSEGSVWVFEPNPKNAKYISKTIEQNRWDNVELFEIALSDVESSDQILINNSKNTGMAKLNELNNSEMNRDNKFEVKTKKLSNILNENNPGEIDLLKMDIEGGERNVIADLRNDLNNVKTIILELHPQILKEGEVRKIYKTLYNNGELTDLDGNTVDINDLFQEKPQIIWQSD